MPESEIFGYIIRQEDLENLALTGHTEVKRNGRQKITYLTNLSNWMEEQVP